MPLHADPDRLSPLYSPSLDRRAALRLGSGALLALLATRPSGATGAPAARMGFEPVPASRRDAVVVPRGYTTQVLYRWGDPTGLAGPMPVFRPDGSNSADEQAAQAGMHHDGMHFFPLDASGRRGLLVLNHEYTDEALLHPDGARVWTAEKVRKSQHAVGVSVIEVVWQGEGWRQVLPSRYARRLHAGSPMRLSGPAAGHSRVRTTADPGGRQVLGTLANCAMGVTPWGTYLTCEENFHGYFGADRAHAPAADPAARRYGTVPGGQWVDWWRFDARFDLVQHPNESHRFGWVVEIDPFDPASTPVKRTALGRKRTESATCTRTRDGRVALYMGDDARFEYLYKFVSAEPVRPGGAAANTTVLDHGTLYAARFDAEGRGQWLPLVHGSGPLTPERGFASQADILIDARLAADAVGATPLDRPEWVAVHPTTGEVYATLTNNTQRGQPGRPGPDAANPRAANTGGQIIRWREDGDDAAATAFRWDLFVLAGDPQQPDAGTRYPSAAADAFACPDGLHFDPDGLLWIQTDMAGDAMGRGPYAALGHNALLCADPATGEIRRFLTGPAGCEITGCVLTPDRRTLFVNIQHPGEAREDGAASPTSAWPDGTVAGSARPRSATVAVWRPDGQPVGR